MRPGWKRVPPTQAYAMPAPMAGCSTASGASGMAYRFSLTNDSNTPRAALLLATCRELAG